MIAITGATGKRGRLVVEGLLERFPAEEVVALARNPYAEHQVAEAEIRSSGLPFVFLAGKAGRTVAGMPNSARR